ncbi:MAG: MarR family winged helix-turn-helix transcriptional regulator [Pseudomonadota bacterium]|nr:MarR family winged helix-turn-helix transcriptional regulator [Pseudomonadota bacterium]
MDDTEEQAKTRRVVRGIRAEAARVLKDDTGWHVRLLARRTGERLDRALAPHGLTSAQFLLMCLVASAPYDTVGGLARLAGLDQSTLSRNLAVLQRQGMVEMVAASADRRRRAVWLTEAGLFALHDALPDWRAAHADIVARIGAEGAAAIAAAAGSLESANDNAG